jgi:hypothetical protein
VARDITVIEPRRTESRPSRELIRPRRQAEDLVERAHALRRVLETPVEHAADEVEVPVGQGGEQ